MMNKILNFSLNKTNNFLLGFILFFVPLLVFLDILYPFSTIKTFFFFAIIEIATLLCLWSVLFSSKYELKNNKIIISYLVFVLVSFLSGVLGVFPEFSFWSGPFRNDGNIVLFHTFLFFILFIYNVRSRKVLNNLIWVSVVSASFVALSVIMGPAGLKIFSFLGDQVIGGTFGNDSYTGIYLLFNLFFILYLFNETREKKKQILLSIFFITILFSPIFLNFDIFRGLISLRDLAGSPMLFLGSARGAAVSFFIGLFFTILLTYIKDKRKNIKFISEISIVVFLSLLIFVISSLFISSSSINRLFMEKTGGYRAVYWNQAIEGFIEKPLLGWGPGNFQFISEKYFDPSVFDNGLFKGSETYSDKAHNIVFDTLSNVGILGLIVYVSIFLFAFMFLWKSKNIKNVNKALFSGILIAYTLHNLSFFDVLCSYIMFSLFLAILIVLDRGEDDLIENKPIFSNKRKGILIFISFSMILVGIFSLRYFVFFPLRQSYVDFHFYTVLLPEQRFSMYEEDRDFSPFGRFQNPKKGGYFILQYYINNLNQIKNSKNFYIYKKDLDGIISEIERGEYPRETFEGISLIYAFYNIRYKIDKEDIFSIKKLKEFSIKEMTFFPKDPRGYINYAQLLFNEKKYKETMNVLEKAYVFSPHNSGIHQALILTARKIGDPKLIEEKIKRAKKDMPWIDFK